MSEDQQMNKPEPVIKKREQTKDKKLSRKDLLEASQNISQYYAPKVSLSAQKLVLLAVDPKHLYAYWNLIENQPDTLSRHLSNNEWVLRVYNQKQKYSVRTKEKPIAEIKINKLQSGQNISLPIAQKETAYSARIGRTIKKHGFVSLIKSNNTRPVHGKWVLAEDDAIITDSEVQFELECAEAFHEELFPHASYYEHKSSSGKGKIKD